MDWLVFAVLETGPRSLLMLGAHRAPELRPQQPPPFLYNFETGSCCRLSSTCVCHCFGQTGGFPSQEMQKEQTEGPESSWWLLPCVWGRVREGICEKVTFEQGQKMREGAGTQ